MKIIKTGEYPSVYMPEHHKAISSNGCVYIHILVAEEKLGRPLTPQECVHHVNENKNDYSKSNIWIFKTMGDHAAYHMAIKNNDNYLLLCENNVYECLTVSCDNYDELSMFMKRYNMLKSSKKKIYICPKCGKEKSQSGKMCWECFNKNRESDIPTGEELSDLLKEYNYSQIGRMYNVTSNAVKKWAKKYDLYERQFHNIPDKNILMALLQKNSRRYVAKIYNVDPETVKNWEEKLGIVLPALLSVECVETGETFESKKLACIAKYPKINPHVASNGITKACKTGIAYKGYHWKALRYIKEFED